MYSIPFNKPHISGAELSNFSQLIASGQKLSGDGDFTKKCSAFLENRYQFSKVLLTTSCTDALEMAAILCDIKPGDEVIAPSYSFVSTVNPFVLRGAAIRFADSMADHPNICANAIEKNITARTKAIVIVHYAGVACDMEAIQNLATKHNLYLIEDAAQAIDAYYKGKPLGSFGHLAAFSFHDTKNIICGEGGMLVINDSAMQKRAEIIREKGTNRSAFFRGEVDKYNWVDIGSSFLPSEINASFLWAQLCAIDTIQQKRLQLWNQYHKALQFLQQAGKCQLPVLNDFAAHNGHIYYLICKNLAERSNLISYLKDRQISASFHYISLHKSPFIQNTFPAEGELLNADRFTDCLVRLPLYYDLQAEELQYVVECLKNFYL